jgi:hypothetical protein
MHFRLLVLTLAGVCALAAGTGRVHGSAGVGQDGTPSMTNDSVEAAPEPLPADWPARAADVQFRGAACDSAFGKEGARQVGETGDDALPIVGTITGNAGSAFLAVRRTPFLTRRDVERAVLSSAGDDSGAYNVVLTLTPEGVAKVKEYTTANTGKCVALVAGGRVIWSTTLTTPVEDEEFVLSGAFSGSKGIAIVDLFGR